MSKEEDYWKGIFKNSDELLRALALILVTKGIITPEELERNILQIRQLNEQQMAKYLEENPGYKFLSKIMNGTMGV